LTAGWTARSRWHLCTFDVSWCRLDLVLLHGPAVADTFLNAYQEAAGEAPGEPALWDLFALANSRRSVETWLPN
jgi:hypothetical protein